MSSAGSFNHLVKVWRASEYITDGQTGNHDLGKLFLRGHSSVVHDVGFTAGGHVISVGSSLINQQGEHPCHRMGKAGRHHGYSAPLQPADRRYGRFAGR